MYKDRDVENIVAPEKTFEEITSGERQSTLHESGEDWNLIWIFLYWIRVANGGAPQIHLFFTQKLTVDQGK
jgi:hypothetical protein